MDALTVRSNPSCETVLGNAYAFAATNPMTIATIRPRYFINLSLDAVRRYFPTVPLAIKVPESNSLFQHDFVSGELPACKRY